MCVRPNHLLLLLFLGLLVIAFVTGSRLQPAPPAAAMHRQERPAPAAARSAAPNSSLSEAEVHRPLAIPDRIILTWTGDPARSQAVTWRTDGSGDAPIAQIAPANPGPLPNGGGRREPARTTVLRSDLGEASYHTVEFQGLTPSTRYAYRVGDGRHWSEWFQFRTASDRPEPFSFLYFGDAQLGLKSQWSRVIRQALLEAPRARFALHAGDLVNTANRDAEWGEWFHAGGWLNGMIPSIPSPGNHEYDRVPPITGVRALSGHWRPQFALPENGPPGLEETVYSLDYQGARIISLNSSEKQAEQVPWLEDRLRDNPCRWTVVTCHHPIHSSAVGHDNPKLRALWEPVLRKYRVDLVLQGHDHTYARSNLNIGRSARNGESGTIYVVSVSGEKMYSLVGKPWMARRAEDTQLFQVISIDGPRLHYEARTAVGALYDAFELRKQPGRINKLIDLAPDTPERRRLTTPPAVSPAGSVVTSEG